MALEHIAFDRSTVSERVANALRDLLLRGEIPPGAKLREVPLAKAIGVSRHTLRGGFRILEAEGLLEHAVNKGVVVPELSPDRIADVFKARKALEFAGIHAISNLEDSQETILNMTEAVSRMKRSRDDSELADADLDFHSAVVTAIGSSMIEGLYRNVQAQLRLTRAWAQRSRGDRAAMVETHGAVLQHLEDGSVELAAQALMTINDVGESRLLQAMSELRNAIDATTSVWPPEPSREGGERST